MSRWIVGAGLKLSFQTEHRRDLEQEPPNFYIRRMSDSGI